MMCEPLAAISTAPELWKQLVRGGGLQPSGWDRELVEALEIRLGRGLRTPLEDLLKVTPVEDLVLAILAELRPFGAMMSDLLELFESHGARHSGAAVAIEFDFGRQGKGDLHFDLREFREARHRLQYATSTVRWWDWDDEAHWKLLQTLRRSLPSTESEPSDPAARAWLDEWEKERWPDRGLAPPETSNRRLAGRLAEIWELWRAVVEESRAAVADGSWKRLQRTEDPTPGDERLILLEVLENDYFSAGLVRMAYTAVEQMERSGSPDAADGLAIALAKLIERYPPKIAQVQVAVETLQDILNLPVFKHRYELYGAWVFTQLVAAWPPGAQLRVVDGVLRFPFKATVLADLLDTAPPGHIVCELRTPLTNPKGKSRKSAVQPDYSVLVGELPDDLQDGSAADLAVMDVECKQYKSPANRDFAYALDDYARGRPKSHVVLVSHGPLNSKAITDKVAAEVRDRTEAIACLDPMHSSARAQLAALVLEKVGPYLVEAPVAPSRSLQVTLTWERAPADLDLHLFIEPGGMHVSYEKPGDLTAEPFAKLHEDARSAPGEEVIEVARCVDRRYVVAVNAYSEDRPLARSDARVRIDLEGIAREWTCPSAGAGRWWHVCEFDPLSGTFGDLDAIHADRPR
jgi:hypothetical protein